ncbi:uncharacterized protein LOC103317050 [Nasonia vitripennis]|uniref:Uncharacterized protein n=1 Tax=Nasonia vitripennis TaxID=7425 RepID=A0A7M7H8N6_NASVI|nr:uncharacterized protein LOC103317050 [Nasonia vitripennis]
MQMKTKAAKSIITSFPKLKSTTGCGYEHFYNEKLSSGFLEWRLKTTRKTSFEKKRTRGKKRPLTDSSNVQVELRLEDYESKIVREFQYQITDKDTFLGRFPSYYAPRILKYCKVTKPRLLDQVRFKKNQRTKKVKLEADFATKTMPNGNLLRIVKANDDIMQAVTNTKNKDPVQPFLIFVTDTCERMREFFIKADNYKIAVGSHIIIAFDILVKMHYVFDLQFSPDLEIFYNFIVSKVMGLDTTARSCCDAFDTTLLHLEEQTLDDDVNQSASEQDEDENL